MWDAEAKCEVYAGVRAQRSVPGGYGLGIKEASIEEQRGVA